MFYTQGNCLPQDMRESYKVGPWEASHCWYQHQSLLEEPAHKKQDTTETITDIPKQVLFELSTKSKQQMIIKP